MASKGLTRGSRCTSTLLSIPSIIASCLCSKPLQRGNLLVRLYISCHAKKTQRWFLYWELNKWNSSGVWYLERCALLVYIVLPEGLWTIVQRANASGRFTRPRKRTHKNMRSSTFGHRPCTWGRVRASVFASVSLRLRPCVRVLFRASPRASVSVRVCAGRRPHPSRYPDPCMPRRLHWRVQRILEVSNVGKQRECCVGP